MTQGIPQQENAAMAGVALTRDNIQSVLEKSLEAPIVLSFFAPSHPDSVAMNTRLAQVINGRGVLATVNCETEMEIASYFRIQALPTVLVISQGQPVDGFAGDKTDAELDAMLAQHLPQAWKQVLQQAKQALADGQDADALALLKSIEMDAAAIGAEWALLMAEAEIAQGELSSAELRLAAVGLADQDAYYHSLKAKLVLAREAADTPEVRELQSRFASAPDNHALRIELARALAQAKREEEALELLFDVLKRDLGAEGGEVKQAFMGILTAMGQGSSIANGFRRKLYSLLY
ncbi:tetratricopeptide repeat protein [Shewanella sp. FJAT-52076]|uniref:tetratricopeptide repeat protein n=1 Tax=Shewanella sp. FJAT-52076 TaxID=2864202 RepID=UPI0038CD5245